jgi:hypothetical protein
MTGPAVKRLFLQLYLNWRYRDRHGLPERVWTWGWGSHGEDFYPGSPNWTGLLDAVPWLVLHFVSRIEPTGSQVMMWDTQRGARDAYLAWEAAHPGELSFGGHTSAVDWNEYPYLRAVAEEMRDFVWTQDLSVGSGVEAYKLAKGGLDAVVLWRSSGTSTVDLSALVGPNVRVVGLETGELYGTNATSVLVGEEPLIVTEDVARVVLVGAPSLGSVIQLRLLEEPGVPAFLFASGATSLIDLPHYGTVLIDPFDAAFAFIGSGGTNLQGAYVLPVAIPANPIYLGVTAHVQGVVATFSGAAAKLTTNRVTVTIQ